MSFNVASFDQVVSSVTTTNSDVTLASQLAANPSSTGVADAVLLGASSATISSVAAETTGASSDSTSASTVTTTTSAGSGAMATVSPARSGCPIVDPEATESESVDRSQDPNYVPPPSVASTSSVLPPDASSGNSSTLMTPAIGSMSTSTSSSVGVSSKAARYLGQTARNSRRAGLTASGRPRADVLIGKDIVAHKDEFELWKVTFAKPIRHPYIYYDGYLFKHMGKKTNKDGNHFVYYYCVTSKGFDSMYWKEAKPKCKASIGIERDDNDYILSVAVKNIHNHARCIERMPPESINERRKWDLHLSPDGAAVIGFDQLWDHAFGTPKMFITPTGVPLPPTGATSSKAKKPRRKSTSKRKLKDAVATDAMATAAAPGSDPYADYYNYYYGHGGGGYYPQQAAAGGEDGSGGVAAAADYPGYGYGYYGYPTAAAVPTSGKDAVAGDASANGASQDSQAAAAAQYNNYYAGYQWPAASGGAAAVGGTEAGAAATAVTSGADATGATTASGSAADAATAAAAAQQYYQHYYGQYANAYGANGAAATGQSQAAAGGDAEARTGEAAMAAAGATAVDRPEAAAAAADGGAYAGGYDYSQYGYYPYPYGYGGYPAAGGAGTGAAAPGQYPTDPSAAAATASGTTVPTVTGTLTSMDPATGAPPPLSPLRNTSATG